MIAPAVALILASGGLSPVQGARIQSAGGADGGGGGAVPAGERVDAAGPEGEPVDTVGPAVESAGPRDSTAGPTSGLAAAPDFSPPSPDASALPAPPDLLRDAALLTVGTAGYALVRNEHRGRILGSGSLGNVLENFRHPIRRALDSEDDDSFLTNYVAHPLTWGGIALYLKREGYSDLGALALSQAHSVYWEYVVEGSYTLPSGRDLVTNFVSSTFVIYGLPLVTGDLFPAASHGRREARPEEPSAVALAPLVAPGPRGPMLQLGLRIR